MLTLLRFITALIVLGLLGGGVFWVLTAPAALDSDLATALSDHSPDPAKGEQVFLAAGCASCHSAPHAEGDAKMVLVGGQKFPSDFGTFVAPNISPDPEQGLGSWSLADFARALSEGVSPAGKHYYPAFPYTSYGKMTGADIADLWAYMQTLPATDTPSQPHDVGFPFSIRRSLGGWKMLFASEDWVMPAENAVAERGRYLVEALGHCAECHTPRNPLGSLDKTRWLAGAPIPGSTGKVPNITPAGLDWSEEDIAYYMESGFTPEFDSVGGHMAFVVENYAKLPASDREAVAAYLAAVPGAE